MDILPPGLHLKIPDAIYRADPGINQSALKAFGEARSPAHFRYEQSLDKEEPDYIRIGNFVDNFYLNPDGWKNFVVYRERRQGKAWQAFRKENKGKTILSEREYDAGSAIISKLELHQDFAQLHNLCHHQAVVIAEHPVFKCRMKAMLDMLPDITRVNPSLMGFVFDVKTAADASADGFGRQARLYGYDIQAAWYMDSLEFIGIMMNTFVFIVVENEPPYEVAVHYLPKDSKEIVEARTRYESWLPSYMECLNSGKWPGYGNQWTRLTLFSKPLKPEREVME